jgi:hypothetical protein
MTAAIYTIGLHGLTEDVYEKLVPVLSTNACV